MRLFTPTVPHNDVSNRRVPDAKGRAESAQALSGQMPLANGDDVSIRQFGAAILLSRFRYTACPTFQRHVAQVSGLCSQKQMRRVDTSRCVATVTNTQTGWNRSEGQFPRHTVGILNGFMHSDLSIPVSCQRSSPEPASVGLLHLRPETRGELLSHVWMITQHTPLNLGGV